MTDLINVAILTLASFGQNSVKTTYTNNLSYFINRPTLLTTIKLNQLKNIPFSYPNMTITSEREGTMGCLLHCYTAL